MKQWLLPSVMMTLGLISIATLKSVAPQLATQQAVFFVIGFAVFFTVSKINYKQWLSIAWIMYAAVCFLLIVSLAMGKLTGRTGRWIPIMGLFNLQPSQLAIPAVVILLCVLNQHRSLDDWHELLKAGALIVIPAALIFIEPDLGTTMVYLVSTAAVVFLSGVSWKKISTIISLGIIASIFAWFFVLRQFQKDRITSFLGLTKDTQSTSYNARQALIAAGSGQVVGRGLGNGVQSHLRFLPERQTDFIFASLAEESGFIGSVFVIVLYTVLVTYLLITAFATPDQAAALFVIAIATMTSMQAGVNIGMNIGILPITGITLPLVSYGGSSVMALCFMYGVVQAITQTQKPRSALHLR